MKRIAIRCAAVLLAALPVLHADTWSLLHDNDFIFDSDDHYSAGLQIGWMGEERTPNTPGGFNRAYVDGFTALLESLGISFEDRRRNGAISLQEMMVTPEDLDSREPIYDDVPYMGVLSSGFTLFAWDENAFDAYNLTLGVIGPRSGAEQLQKRVHEIVGAAEPRGWDNQLGSRGLFQAGYVRGVRQYLKEYGDDRRLEWFNSYHVDLGTFYCGAGVGTALRYGSAMPRGFSTPGGLLNSIQSDKLAFSERTRDTGWELHAGLFVSGIAYLYFYDAAKRAGYRFDRPRVIPKLNLGASLYYERWRLSLDIFPAGSSNANSESSSFGRISLTWSPE